METKTNYSFIEETITKDNSFTDNLIHLKTLEDVIYYVISYASTDYFITAGNNEITKQTEAEVLLLFFQWIKAIKADKKYIENQNIQGYLDTIQTDSHSSLKNTIEAIRDYHLYFYPLLRVIEEKVPLDKELKTNEVVAAMYETLETNGTKESNFATKAFLRNQETITKMLLEDLQVCVDSKKERNGAQKRIWAGILALLAISVSISPHLPRINKGLSTNKKSSDYANEDPTSGPIIISKVLQTIQSTFSQFPSQLRQFNEWIKENDPIKFANGVVAEKHNMTNHSWDWLKQLISEDYSKILKAQSTSVAMILNKQDVNGNTKIHDFAQTQDPELLLFIIENRKKIQPDFRIQNNKDVTPFEMFLYLQNYRCLKILVENAEELGLDFNTIFKSDAVANYYLLGSHDPAITQLLFDNFEKLKIDFNQKNNRGNTPLSVLINEARHEITEELLITNRKRFNLNFNLKNNDGATPLWFIIKTKNSRLLKHLINSTESGELRFNEKVNDGTSILDYAMLNGDFDIAKLLMENAEKLQLNFNLLNDFSGITPLGFLVSLNNIHFVRLLIEHSDKIKPNFLAPYGTVSVIWYVLTACDESIRNLIFKNTEELRIDLNGPYRNDRSLLSYATSKQQSILVERLLQSGVLSRKTITDALVSEICQKRKHPTTYSSHSSNEKEIKQKNLELNMERLYEELADEKCAHITVDQIATGMFDGLKEKYKQLLEISATSKLILTLLIGALALIILDRRKKNKNPNYYALEAIVSTSKDRTISKSSKTPIVNLIKLPKTGYLSSQYEIIEGEALFHKITINDIISHLFTNKNQVLKSQNEDVKIFKLLDSKKSHIISKHKGDNSTMYLGKIVPPSDAACTFGLALIKSNSRDITDSDYSLIRVINRKIVKNKIVPIKNDTDLELNCNSDLKNRILIYCPDHGGTPFLIDDSLLFQKKIKEKLSNTKNIHAYLKKQGFEIKSDEKENQNTSDDGQLETSSNREIIDLHKTRPEITENISDINYPTMGDGNCLIHALTGELNKNKVIENKNHQEIRKQLIAFLNDQENIDLAERLMQSFLVLASMIGTSENKFKNKEDAFTTYEKTEWEYEQLINDQLNENGKKLLAIIDQNKDFRNKLKIGGSNTSVLTTTEVDLKYLLYNPSDLTIPKNVYELANIDPIKKIENQKKDQKKLVIAKVLKFYEEDGIWLTEEFIEAFARMKKINITVHTGVQYKTSVKEKREFYYAPLNDSHPITINIGIQGGEQGNHFEYIHHVEEWYKNKSSSDSTVQPESFMTDSNLIESFWTYYSNADYITHQSIYDAYQSYDFDYLIGIASVYFLGKKLSNQQLTRVIFGVSEKLNNLQKEFELTPVKYSYSRYDKNLRSYKSLTDLQGIITNSSKTKNGTVLNALHKSKELAANLDDSQNFLDAHNVIKKELKKIIYPNKENKNLQASEVFTYFIEENKWYETSVFWLHKFFSQFIPKNDQDIVEEINWNQMQNEIVQYLLIGFPQNLLTIEFDNSSCSSTRSSFLIKLQDLKLSALKDADALCFIVQYALFLNQSENKKYGNLKTKMMDCIKQEKKATFEEKAMSLQSIFKNTESEDELASLIHQIFSDYDAFSKSKHSIEEKEVDIKTLNYNIFDGKNWSENNLIQKTNIVVPLRNNFGGNQGVIFPSNMFQNNEDLQFWIKIAENGFVRDTDQQGIKKIKNSSNKSLFELKNKSKDRGDERCYAILKNNYLFVVGHETQKGQQDKHIKKYQGYGIEIQK